MAWWFILLCIIVVLFYLPWTQAFGGLLEFWIQNQIKSFYFRLYSFIFTKSNEIKFTGAKSGENISQPLGFFDEVIITIWTLKVINRASHLSSQHNFFLPWKGKANWGTLFVRRTSILKKICFYLHFLSNFFIWVRGSAYRPRLSSSVPGEAFTARGRGWFNVWTMRWAYYFLGQCFHNC